MKRCESCGESVDLCLCERYGYEFNNIEGDPSDMLDVNAEIHAHDALVEIEDDVADWAEETFPEATLETVTKHLRREEAELAEASGGDVAEELADCWMILTHLRRMINNAEAYLLQEAAGADVNLHGAVKEKLALNRDRRWDEPDAEGVVEHVREAESSFGIRRCRLCGCTDLDCSGCVEKTGFPCHWIERDLCSACVGEATSEEVDAD